MTVSHEVEYEIYSNTLLYMYICIKSTYISLYYYFFCTLICLNVYTFNHDDV